MLREIRLWLGPARIRLLAGLLIGTGIASLVLQVAFPGESWSLGAQTLLFLIFLGGAALVIGSRMAPADQWRLAFRVIPALIAVLIGLVVTDYFRLFLGGALGWLIAAQVLLRNPEKREYKEAIRAMRRRDYSKAIDIMTGLIKKEAQDPAHYSYRAQLYRLNGDLRRAKSDYQTVIKLDPESGVGQNGLAEISLQEGSLPEARQWGEQAYAKAPQDWAALYNLGMIADRQQDSEAALDYLEQALKVGLPDHRHRLLAKLWLLRAYYRLDQPLRAQEMVNALNREKSGLNEWKIVLNSPEAENIRKSLEADVQQAEKLLQGKSVTEVLDAGR